MVRSLKFQSINANVFLFKWNVPISILSGSNKARIVYIRNRDIKSLYTIFISLLDSLDCLIFSRRTFLNTSQKINKWSNHLCSLQSKNRYSFIIKNAHKATVSDKRSKQRERETKVGERPWCSSLGHSLTMI